MIPRNLLPALSLPRPLLWLFLLACFNCVGIVFFVEASEDWGLDASSFGSHDENEMPIIPSLNPHQLYYTEDTMAVTATTMWAGTPHKGGTYWEDIDSGDPVPYVHWVCFREKLPVHKIEDKLRCCQQIYKMMESESSLLCWKKNKCMAHHKKRGKAEFMHYCTQQVVQLPFATISSNEEQQSQRQVVIDEKERDMLSHNMTPQYSLVLPGDSPVLHPKKNMWRQCVGFSSLEKWNQYFYEVKSPVQLTVHPDRFFKDCAEKAAEQKQHMETGGVDEAQEAAKKDDEKEKEETFTNDLALFGANVNTQIFANEDEEEYRDLNHLLSVAFSDESAEILYQQKDNWKVEIQVLFFLPEGILLRKKNNLSACGPSTTSDVWTVDCHVHWKQFADDESTATTKKKFRWPQQQATLLTVTLVPKTFTETATNPPSFETFTLKWMTSFLLEDDDLLVPSPVIYSGFVSSTSTSDAATKRLLQWDAVGAIMGKPMSTVLDDDGNPIDAAKHEF